MCGIIGIISRRNIVPVLTQGLKRLEYRGYDSAGVAVIHNSQIQRVRCSGKVSKLEQLLGEQPIQGSIGIAHTRWATHGKPSENNAHPHVSRDHVALVHNGIIENYAVWRAELIAAGYEFDSETDSEVVAHLIQHSLAAGLSLLDVLLTLSSKLKGIYALAVINRDDPTTIIGICQGSPLVVGLGAEENYLASDVLALGDLVKGYVCLEEGDIVKLNLTSYQIYDKFGNCVSRLVHTNQMAQDPVELGLYTHFMQKEIFEQPVVLADTLKGRSENEQNLYAILNSDIDLQQVKHIQIVACGTSYHAGLVASYWLESIAEIDCRVEIASEFRYRKKVVLPDTLLIAISQSGETADTLAALRQAKEMHYLSTLAICNVAHSSLVRQSDLSLMTRAGPEIGVASTKAFTTQLVALLLLTLALARRRSNAEAIAQLLQLPELVRKTLELDEAIKLLANRFKNKQHALFLGRGEMYPIACEGALKLKELSYIHAEAYPAGELKHGPLALVDENMPVIAVAPNDELIEKLKSNLEEVKARGGELIIFADIASRISNTEGVTIIPMPATPSLLIPIIYTLPLQLLAYHVAILKGTNIDQPRNLAKSVTVE